jgi:hypothetical protein
MQQIQSLYLQFLDIFPKSLHPFISIALAVFLIYSIIQVIRKDFIYLIVLIVLLPASIPILKNIGDSIIMLVKFLLNIK